MEPISAMNRPGPTRPDPARPGPTRPDRDAFFRRLVLKNGDRYDLELFTECLYTLSAECMKFSAHNMQYFQNYKH